jgi:uncharacterized protein (TIGR00725 family)
MTARRPIVAVCGASQPTDEDVVDAVEVGRLLALSECVVVCGGLGGVMAAAGRGATAAGGVCIGLLPGDDPADAAPEMTIALATGMGEMRNALIARCCGAMIAIGGGYGSLSEIALALRLARPVAALHTWEMRAPDGREPAETLLHRATSPGDAVEWVLQHIAAGKPA